MESSLRSSEERGTTRRVRRWLLVRVVTAGVVWEGMVVWGSGGVVGKRQSGVGNAGVWGLVWGVGISGECVDGMVGLGGCGVWTGP